MSPRATFAQLTDAELAEACLSSWEQLGRVLRRLERAEVERLLRWEFNHRRNQAIMKRLHQRFTRLRAIDEWHDLETDLRSTVATGWRPSWL